MTAAVLMSAAFSALLHACWNMLAQQNSAPRDLLQGFVIATATLCLVAFPFIGAPIPQTWPWIGMASLVNVFYLRILGRAYVHPDFCVVYAIVRSTVPAVLFLIGLLVFNESERLCGLIGLAIVVTSILIFALPQTQVNRTDLKTLIFSVFSGLLLALALLLDVVGIRTAGRGFENLLQYAVASSLSTAASLTILSLTGRANPVAILIANGRRCFLGALLLLCSYLFGMWAYSQGPIGMVAPVRESSILFGGLLSVFVLRQYVTRAQWAAMALATIGIVLVQAG